MSTPLLHFKHPVNISVITPAVPPRRTALSPPSPRKSLPNAPFEHFQVPHIPVSLVDCQAKRGLPEPGLTDKPAFIPIRSWRIDGESVSLPAESRDETTLEGLFLRRQTYQQ